MNKKFEFTYTAPTEDERNEIRYIQSQYREKEHTTLQLERLRKLDNKVKSIPTCFSLVVGITGLLIFGLGLAMILEWKLIVWGVIISIIGCIPIGFAHYTYSTLYNKLKNKYSEEILNISSELLNENNER